MGAVAIAKDHPLQSLTQIGDQFVVNMLEEGNYLDLMKHFQKDIMPGEDIFAGVETTEVQAGYARGIAVTGCSAYLTCTVYSRMDAGDHILICGEALQGQVVRDARPQTTGNLPPTIESRGSCRSWRSLKPRADWSTREQR